METQESATQASVSVASPLFAAKIWSGTALKAENNSESITIKHAIAKFYLFFCLFSYFYAVTINFVTLIVANESFLLNHFSVGTPSNFFTLATFLAVIVFVFYVVMVRFNNFFFSSFLILKLFAIIFYVLFWPSFTSAKNLMSHVSNFTWDHTFASIDNQIHFGTDPWLLYITPLNFISFETIDYIYLYIWAYLSFFLPIYIIIFETSLKIRIVFFSTYAIVWVGLGNLVAWAFLSAGPIFYDKVTGDASKFAEFFATIEKSGFGNSYAIWARDYLWKSYIEGNQFLGSGISAFPSVHVGMATLIGLYIWAKLGRFGVVALAYPFAIQIFSVLLGWHYAIDGYFSILVVALSWRMLGRHLDASFTETRPAGRGVLSPRIDSV